MKRNPVQFRDGGISGFIVGIGIILQGSKQPETGKYQYISSGLVDRSF